MKMYEQQRKLHKIHKNIEGMLKQAKNIIKSSNILPPINQPSRSEIETLLPTYHHNKRILSLFQGSHQRSIKNERRHNKSQHLKNPQTALKDKSELRLSQEKIAPIFYNKNTGRYQLSTLLGRYQSELLDSSTTARLAKRSSRELYNKKMINLLPEIPHMNKKKGENLHKQKSSGQNKQDRYYQYHATINVAEDIWSSTHSADLPHPYPQTIDYNNQPSHPIEKDNVEKAIKKKKQKISPRVRINEVSILQKLEATKTNIVQNRQIIEDQKCQPWNYDKLQESDDFFK